MDDNRLFLLKNLYDLQNSEIKTETNEYELLTDASILGKFEYGPYILNMWDLTSQKGQERRIYLKIIENAENHLITYDQIHSGDAIYGTPHEVANELVSLTSLFLRKKLWIKSHLFINDIPSPNNLNSNWIDKDLIEGTRYFNELNDWFSLIKKLNPRIQRKFLTSARFYHRAILTIEDEPDLAYLHLVTAIEILSQDYKLKNISIEDLNNEKLIHLVKKINDVNLRKELEKQLLKERFLSKRFVFFILDHVEANFWQKRNKPWEIKNYPELKKYLQIIYNQRSRTLHDGMPFPANIFHSPLMNEDIEISGIQSGNDKRKTNEIVPYPKFFEELVHHVLITFLKRNLVD